MDKSTLKYIGKRLVMSAITLMIIVFVLFVMLKFMPGTPFNDEKLTETQKALIYVKYGFDKPIWEQFVVYFKNMLSGDFGISYGISRNLPVSSLVLPRISISFGIGLAAVILGTILGILLGIFAALNRNTVLDSLSTVVAVFGVSIPSFVFCLILLIIFGVKMPALPILYNSSHPIKSAIIPVIALSVSVIANVARFTRSEMIEVMESDYILLAESKGLDRRTLIKKHALRNTLVPIITVLAPILVALMTGSMVIEQICGIPGLGSLLVQAITVNDYNVTMAVAFIYSVMYVVIMLLVDILYGIIDPRIRLGKGSSNE
ncbi:ABC transporter permease [Romboutsia sp. 1001713B170207_170306_H8]|uniref:ABC transporter permease n=1 Tax=Romboutsia sp. 1001713B170207_170306_H8 TaxID=2787112 RepID=UPI0008232345|nr:ABC transporter permease [Romboutsia sp. 1001713B170207_170306_H8]SCH70389.1 Oligopeptide transport system permease protein oppB [uncultured Clostridium sp.]